MQELDGVKNRSRKLPQDSENDTYNSVMKATKYLNGLLEAKSSRVIGQSPSQAKECKQDFLVANNDDRIIQCCSQWQTLHKDAAGVALVTFDVHLRSKALIASVPVFKENIFGFLKQPDPVKTNNSLAEKNNMDLKQPDLVETNNSLAERNTMDFDYADDVKEKDQLITIEKKTLTYFTSLLSARQQEKVSGLKTVCMEVIEKVLGYCLEKEMKRIYGDLWKAIVFRKPPWNAKDILFSLKKHWIAVYGEFFSRQRHLEEGISECCELITSELNVKLLKRLAHHLQTFCVALSKKPGYAKVVDGSSKSLKDQVTHLSHVQESLKEELVFSAFQSIWEFINVTISKFEQYFLCPPCDNRQFAFGHLAKFCVLLNRVYLSYRNLLSCDSVNCSHNASILLLRLTDFSQELEFENVDVMQSLHSSCISYVLTDASGREKISNGFFQLEAMMKKISNLEQHFTPEEVQRIQSAISSNSWQ